MAGWTTHLEVMEPVWDMTNRPQLADDDEGEHYQAWMEDGVMRFREVVAGSAYSSARDVAR